MNREFEEKQTKYTSISKVDCDVCGKSFRMDVAPDCGQVIMISHGCIQIDVCVPCFRARFESELGRQEK